MDGSPDPVVVYDVMQEAATHVRGHYMRLADAGTLTIEQAVDAIQRLGRLVESVDPYDTGAQRQMTDRLHALIAETAPVVATART